MAALWKIEKQENWHETPQIIKLSTETSTLVRTITFVSHEYLNVWVNLDSNITKLHFCVILFKKFGSIDSLQIVRTAVQISGLLW